MDQNMPANVLNELFISKAENAEDRVKLAQAGAAYVRDKLRELGFTRKILPPKPISVSDCYVSTTSDTIYKVVHVEPGAWAMSLSFRGEPDAELIKGRRMPVTFFTIASPKWEGFVEELRTYPYPITDVIKNNSAKEIQTVEDRYFLLHCNTAVVQRHQIANAVAGVPTASALNGTRLTGGLVAEDSIVKGEIAREDTDDDAVIHPMQKTDVARLAKRFTASGRSLRMAKMLMTEFTFADFAQLTTADLGDKLASEVMVSGYKKNTVLGHQIITSLKGNILHDGLVYGFTAPEFLGKSYILDNVKFFVKKEFRKISFLAWENIGMGLVNIASVNRLELFSRDATIVGGAGYLAVAPSAEEDLDAVNNYVVDGYAYPVVQVY